MDEDTCNGVVAKIPFLCRHDGFAFACQKSCGKCDHPVILGEQMEGKLDLLDGQLGQVTYKPFDK